VAKRNGRLGGRIRVREIQIESHPRTLVTADQSISGIIDSVDRSRSIQPALGIRALGLGKPILSAMAGHLHCQFQPTPYSKFVKCATQMILDYLFASTNDPWQFRDWSGLRALAIVEV
jgi:hypothetical protein